MLSSEVVIGLLGVAVTLNVAAIAALGWLINFTIRLDGGQTASRHAMAVELIARHDATHADMSRRLERIEDRLNAVSLVSYRLRRADDE